MDVDGATWRTSSYTGSTGGNCRQSLLVGLRWCRAASAATSSTAKLGLAPTQDLRNCCHHSGLPWPPPWRVPASRCIFQGPAVRVLAKGFTEKLHGPGRAFSRFARAGLAKAGHIPAQEKIGQLQALGAHLYICGPSMQHFNVAKTDLAFDDVTIAEYLTFMEIMANADIHVFVQ